MMDLTVNIPLEKALDRGWEILAECFEPQETGQRTQLLEKFWPKREQVGAGEHGEG
jgi:V/A-type H+-transporting ATPase subunit B